ncbi:MAG: helix-hairpin-helix domain-containing protein [Litorilinea sp.]
MPPSPPAPPSGSPTEMRHSPRPVWHGPSFVLGLLISALGAGLLFIVYRAPQPPPIVLQPPPTPAPTATALPTSTPAPIVVYLSGAVQQPGLYTLPVDARVGDVLAMGGGFADHAAVDSLNLAERVWDGARVHVGSHAAMGSDNPQIIATEATAGDISTSDTPPTPVTGISGSAPPTPTGENTAGADITGRVNLNTADQSQLETLPGIGPSRAQAIIANRPYASVDDITRVPGIAEGILLQLRDLVTVE